MLYSIIVNFKPEEDALISPTRGYHAYALFLDLLRQANPTVAQRLHDLEGPKPFTLSPLQGRFQHQRSGLKLTAGQTYWIRLTVLQEELFAHLLDALLKAADRSLRLDTAPLTLNEVLTTPGQSPWCNCQDFDTLLSHALPERRLHLRFFSPTAFRSAGKRNVLFPEPRLLFSSYLARWQAFSPLKLSSDLASLADKGSRIGRYKLETRILHFGSYQETGFEGECTVEIADEVPQEAVKALNALADFAFYSGTGAKTTMGMGQTRRLRDAGPLSRGAGSHPAQG
ncbi:MAG: CRISPR-associated endoribonuclease Cas6 [Chloroflexi bacterium]|nr:MAG: CRISPR-associated endoribonuclease Cas6 [Chloroflexota bacterium]